MKACSFHDNDLNEWARVYRPPVEPLKRGEIEVEPEQTFREIAQQLGVTPQAVQQLQRSALKKCYAWCRERGLRLEDLITIR